MKTLNKKISEKFGKIEQVFRKGLSIALVTAIAAGNIFSFTPIEAKADDNFAKKVNITADGGLEYIRGEVKPEQIYTYMKKSPVGLLELSDGLSAYSVDGRTYTFDGLQYRAKLFKDAGRFSVDGIKYEDFEARLKTLVKKAAENEDPDSVDDTVKATQLYINHMLHGGTAYNTGRGYYVDDPREFSEKSYNLTITSEKDSGGDFSTWNPVKITDFGKYSKINDINDIEIKRTTRIYLENTDYINIEDTLPKDRYKLENGALTFYIANRLYVDDIEDSSDWRQEEERLIKIINDKLEPDKKYKRASSINDLDEPEYISYSYDISTKDIQIIGFAEKNVNYYSVRGIPDIDILKPQSIECIMRRNEQKLEKTTENVYERYQELKNYMENFGVMNTDDNFNADIEISNVRYQKNSQDAKNALLTYDLQLKMENSANMERVDFPRLTQRYSVVNHGREHGLMTIDDKANKVEELGNGRFRVTVKLYDGNNYLKDEGRIKIDSKLKMQGKDDNVKGLFLLVNDVFQNLITASEVKLNLEAEFSAEAVIKGNISVPELSKTDQKGRAAKGARFQLWMMNIPKKPKKPIVWIGKTPVSAGEDDLTDVEIKFSVKGTANIPIKAKLLINGAVDAEEQISVGKPVSILVSLKDTDKVEVRFSYPKNIALSSDAIEFNPESREFILTLPDNLNISSETEIQQNKELNGTGNMDRNDYADEDADAEDVGDDDSDAYTDDTDTEAASVDEDSADDGSSDITIPDEDTQADDDTSDDQTEDENDGDEDEQILSGRTVISMLHSASAVGSTTSAEDDDYIEYDDEDEDEDRSSKIHTEDIQEDDIDRDDIENTEEEDKDLFDTISKIISAGELFYNKIAEIVSEDDGNIDLNKLELADGRYYLVEISGPTSIPDGAISGAYWAKVDVNIRYEFDIDDGEFTPRSDNIKKIYDGYGNVIGYKIENELIEVPGIPPDPYIPPIIPDKPPEVPNNPMPLLLRHPLYRMSLSL